MRKEPCKESKKYAIYIILFGIYVVLSWLDADKELEVSSLGYIIGFFFVMVFGLIPFMALVNAYFFTYKHKSMREKIRIVRDSFNCLKKWLIKN